MEDAIVCVCALVAISIVVVGALLLIEREDE